MEEEVKVNIYIIRHGEKSEDGLNLSKNGIQQVKHLARRLKKIGINMIYSSDIPRCKATTEIIAKQIKTNIIYSQELREIEGHIKENPSKYPEEIKRIKKFWEKITKDKGNILIVGSGNVNRVILAMAMGISPEKSRFVQIPSGLSHLEFINEEKTRIVYVNDTSHLPENLKKRQAY